MDSRKKPQLIQDKWNTISNDIKKLVGRGVTVYMTHDYITPQYIMCVLVTGNVGFFWEDEIKEIIGCKIYLFYFGR